MNAATCTATWFRFDDVRSTSGGTLSTTSNSLDSCLDECQGNDACIFINFQVSLQRCFIHTNAMDLNHLQTDDDYRHYVLINRCDPSNGK